MKFVEFNLKISGIYFWGKGWNETDSKIWKDYFNNLRNVWWNYVCENNKTDYLVSINGGAMIHPMDGIKVYFCEEVESDSMHIKSKIESLIKIFDNLKKLYDGRMDFTYEIKEYSVVQTAVRD